ncbi:unnamed protein product [Rotaria sordida]|uniref:Uncharacterized protein n=1 Tax=Rotaria sordida TaxID=392033 RepID=A0A815FTC5_9BILA|nr:unnamed protein product [Rotaria sordida]CAF4137325.1 unnamed protein product [Rotaria sordida]
MENSMKRITDEDMTCYIMFNCRTYIDICLDWRRICDGLRNCTNGRDEENCLEMEYNECDLHSKYRCHNGMCIPKSFSFDLTMDCMNYYDEQEYRDTSLDCSKQSSVDCEDHTCRLNDFSCGNDSCFKDYTLIENNQNQIYENKSDLNDDCWRQMWCLLGIFDLFEINDIFRDYDEEINETLTWCQTYENIELSCPEEFFFPPSYFLLPFV